MSEQDPNATPGHAFISYVREDEADVGRIYQALDSAGIQVWRDTSHLWPGEDWRAKIRQAITDNTLVFIACFSHNSLDRQVSYQNEELTLAIDQMRLRRPDVPWLIPVRLSECEIPDRDIGGGRTLGSIHRADLFGDHREEEMARVVTTVLGLLPQREQSWDAAIQEALDGNGDLYLQGVSLHAAITRASHALERRLQQGFTVRVLLTHPGTPAFRLAVERVGPASEYKGLHYRAEASLAHLGVLKSASRDRLQVRLTAQDLSFSAAVIRPGSRQAVMYVQYYAYRPQGGMRLALRATDDLGLYNDHLNQINDLWDHAATWTPERP